MPLYLVKSSAITEIEANSAKEAEVMFEGMAQGLMENGGVAYHKPVLEEDFQDDDD